MRRRLGASRALAKRPPPHIRGRYFEIDELVPVPSTLSHLLQAVGPRASTSPDQMADRLVPEPPHLLTTNPNSACRTIPSDRTATGPRQSLAPTDVTWARRTG